MRYIHTTFAHGNGPFSRCLDWAISVNDARERKGFERLPIVVPLVYPERQEKIIREEIGAINGSDFFEKHPDEILLDEQQGALLSQLMFKGNNYAENLACLIREYSGIEAEILRHLDGKRTLRNFAHGEIVDIDLRDAEFQLGINNRVQTELPHQFYSAGGAGPFDEILERAVYDKQVSLDKEILKAVLPIARRLMENQRIVFSNEPGVFSYDASRQKRDNEVSTPGFIHPPKPDTTPLPCRGIYLLMTGIDGIRESGLFDAVADFGMQIYVSRFSMNGLPEPMRAKAIALNPNQIHNPNIVAQYARAGWSTVWLSQMAEKGFITPPYQHQDDPEILFNQRGIVDLGLGVVMGDDPKSSLEKAIELSQNLIGYNQRLIDRYGTLDGITYASEIVVGAFI